MGRPTHVKPLPTGANRRDFFKRSGSGAVLLAAAPLATLNAEAAVPAAVFQHGVASGDPLTDRVILWTRVSPVTPKPSITVGYVLATDPALTQVVQVGSTKTNPGRDYTVKIDATRLQPGKTYYYRFNAEGEVSPVGRTKTLPVGSVSRLRMAVVSCSNHAYGYFNAYARVAQRADLDLVVHLGDYLYEYGAGQYGTVRTPEPATEMVTLADYRARHAQYKRDADLQAAHRQHAFITIWDDHEIANDSWVGGAQNHTPGTEGPWAQRVADGLKAYYEWMPIRAVDTADLRHNQRSFRFGDLVELVMLEERLGARSQQLPATIPLGNNQFGFTQTGAFADPARTLLGADQEAWLFGKLRTTPARWKLLGQGVMLSQIKAVGAPNAFGGGVFFNSDAWDGYQPARNRLYDVIKGDGNHAKVDNVVVLTGDIHSSWAADLTPDPNNPVVGGGGYNATTGEGSLAVEFVGTSITSPGFDFDTDNAFANSLKPANPHFKYINLHRRGYMVVDVTPQRAVGEWYYVDTVASPSNIETFAVAFEVQQGTNRLAPAAQTTPPANPPQLAP